ncbi:uroporphyrinogen-III C-methyltransferase [Chloroflexi bacterium TSY]|nr:uroporphyrinogen-III C-methyltransferase [Chloroflexi bacterium TSY]
MPLNGDDDKSYPNSLNEPVPTGRVYLVGAGPGDPTLLTVRGYRALQQADVILYDRLSAPELLAFAKPDALCINVGKAPTRNRYPQSEINRLLVGYGKKGQTVVRLKGGDPFVFGLGGDECLSLKEAGIRYEVIPGVSSMTAVPAYAGIPVTHRGVSTMLTVLSAHDANAEQIGGIPWMHLPKQGTLVILMGAKKLPLIVEQLLTYHANADTPIAVIESGTTAAQKVKQSTVREMRQTLEPIPPPALIVVGEVVRLREKLQWFQASLATTEI